LNAADNTSALQSENEALNDRISKYEATIADNEKNAADL